MWILQKKSDGKNYNTFILDVLIESLLICYNLPVLIIGRKLHLLNGELTVGRKNGHIQTPEDASVSRNHLILKVEYPKTTSDQIKVNQI